MNWLDAPTHDGDWLVQCRLRSGKPFRSVARVWTSDGEHVDAGTYVQLRRDGDEYLLGSLLPRYRWLEIEWPEVA